MQQVYTVTRARPRNTISMVLLAVIDTAFNKHNARTLRSVCEDNIGKFAKSPAHASNVATAVRFPLGEIDGRSIGMHVYLSNNGDEPIHSHGQNFDTFAFKGVFQDEIFGFAPGPNGPFVKYKITREFSDKVCRVFFERKAKFFVSHSYRRTVKEGDIGYLSAEKAHTVQAHEGVITLYRFSGPLSDSSTFLPEKSPLSLRDEQTAAEKEKLIEIASNILKDVSSRNCST